MGYVTVAPPGLGTYPSIETTRPLRWSAFEECGVRQVKNESIVPITFGLGCCDFLSLSPPSAPP